MVGSTNRNQIDLGPGETHIAIRNQNKSFYVPEVFHMAPTEGKIIPLFIADINRSKSLIELYGSRGFEKYMNNFILINNYPIRKIKVTGKIIGETFKDYGEGKERNSKNHVLITLDDFSGAGNLTIVVRVKESMYLSSGFVFNNSYGKIIEVVGVVNELTSRREILTDYVGIVGNNEDLDKEIQNWKETLEIRNSLLRKPWIYEPPKSDRFPVIYSEPKLLRKDYNRKKYKEHLEIIEVEDDSTPSLFREDSILLMQSTNSANNNVIDLTDSPEDATPLKRSAINESRGIDISCQMVPESDVQILEVNDVKYSDSQDGNPIHNVEEFQLILEFILWILNKGEPTFKLIELYSNVKIKRLLDDLTQLRLHSRYINPINTRTEDMKHIKYEIFHTVRHLLHINYKLIDVSPDQDVYLDNLLQLKEHLKYCLNVIRLHRINEDKTTVLNVDGYMNIFRNHSNTHIGDINYKLINGIIDWILVNDFNNRNKWKYDSKAMEWSYIG